MIIDALNLPNQTSINCDVCIVGAGASGITLANELSKKNMNIILLESGGMEYESDTQDLYKGEVADNANHGALDQYRDRRFGGTTTVWGGRCAPFDAIDFEHRPHVPHSGWPITKSDLDPYYERAHEYCELGSYEYEAHKALNSEKQSMVPGFMSDAISLDKLWLFSPPTNFAKAYKDKFDKSSRIDVYLHANCLRIVLNEIGNRVEYLECASLQRNQFFVYANHFVLSAGGLEVTRLLLASNDVHKNGIGNDNDLVGRFYMSHISGTYGKLQFKPRDLDVIWDYEKTLEGVYCRRRITVAEEQQRMRKLLNFSANLDHPPPEDPSHHNGVLSSLYLSKLFFARQIPPEYSKALSSMSPYQNLRSHINNIIFDIPNVILFSGMWMNKRILRSRKLPSVSLKSKSNLYMLHFDAEQTPNPNSRVTLCDDKDSFGINRIKVEWKYSDSDIESVCQAFQLIKKEVEKSDIGDLQISPMMPSSIRENCTVGSHHIGTTRMADNPSSGVVNENCQIYGVSNLYVASSSVFPTSGCANPTLTIIAIAIRLADYLKNLNH